VKLGISTILPERPDLVVSGINGGLNVGINVLYSGTVAAAVEGAFYGITSVAVSLQYDENEPFPQAAELATSVIGKILKQQEDTPGRLYNINIPLKALRHGVPEVKVVPMDATQYWETFERRVDPMGRAYYWLSGRPDPRQPKNKNPEQMTDMAAVSQGYIAVTPLNYDVTDRKNLKAMTDWDLTPQKNETSDDHERTGPQVRVSWRN
jgi:5'-nucleotidase